MLQRKVVSLSLLLHPDKIVDINTRTCYTAPEVNKRIEKSNEIF